MSVAQLFNVPRSPLETNEWSFANADSHALIIEAILAKYGKTLESFVLDPLPQLDIPTFLLRHQAMHNAFDLILGIAGNDYTNLDFSGKGAQPDSDWFQHASEHVQAHTILGIT